MKRWEKVTFAEKAALIRSTGDSRTFTDRDILSKEYGEVPLNQNGKVPVVEYVGGSYVLPVVEKVLVDGRELTAAKGEFVVTYTKNDRVGSAKLTITLTPGDGGAYPLGGSKSWNFKIVSQQGGGVGF